MKHETRNTKFEITQKSTKGRASGYSQIRNQKLRRDRFQVSRFKFQGMRAGFTPVEKGNAPRFRMLLFFRHAFFRFLLWFSKKRLPAASSLAGFTLVEGVVAVAILAAVLIGVTNIAQFSSRLLDGSQNTLSASFLLEEGVEAVKSIRDSGWDTNISPLALDTDYWLLFSGGSWALTTTPEPYISGLYERKIRFSSVSRGAGDDIVSSGGVLDANTKKVSVSVAWSYRGVTTTDTVGAYITNLFAN